MMEYSLSRPVCIAAILLFAPSWPGARAAAFPHTPEEFAKLPPYCAARMKQADDPAAYKAWQSRMHPNCFIHIHHYCAALNDVEHAMMARTKKERDQYLLDSMAGGFDYMWNQAGASCPMMPEILVSKGKALAMLDKPSEAATSFQRAIQLNQRFIPAYTALADLYKKTGQTDTARRLLEYALRIDPKSVALNRRLAELGSSGKSANTRNSRNIPQE